MKVRSRLVLATKLMVVAALLGAAWIAPSAASAAAPVFNANSQVTAQQPPGWDEPSGIAGSDGQPYVASQNPNAPTGSADMTLSQSMDGVNWHESTPYYTYLNGRAEGQTGDVTTAADHAGTIFVGHLTGALQADIDWTRDGGKTWQTANDVATLPSPGAGSSSPGLVDRPWIGVYSPDTNYKDTQVYLEYHDFVTSAIYIVTCSMATGSLQCGAPVPVSNAQTACNSIPGGVAVSPAGSSHPGRVYTVWTTADPQTNAVSGCNYTQLAPFYAMYVAWSDTPSDPTSWHQVPVYIGPNGSSENCPDTAPVGGVSTNTCADMSELFTPVAVDSAGNVYISFIDYIDTIDKHYDVYLARSTDGGTTWDGKSDGSGQPIMVSDAGGTHYTPNLAAGSAGRVALIYYRTGYATKPYMNGDTCPTTVPPETSCQGKNQPEPPSAAWTTEVAQSIDAAAAQPHFSQVQVSDPGVVVHYGDICNLGIYCDGSSTGNRSLFENNTVFPNAGGNLVAAWGDQRLDPRGQQDAGQSNAQSLQVAYDEIFATSQISGRSLFATASGTPPRGKPGPRCARPSGRLNGLRIGPVALGMTRANARRAFRHFSTRQRRLMDFFCLSPGGIRAGYPSRRLLLPLRSRQRRRLQNRVVLLLTATPYYALRGVRPGAALTAARRVLKLGRPFHIGLNYWYLAPNGADRAALKVRHGIVEEIGIANSTLTASRRAAFRFFTSFS
ncbi:MAG TPA: hypothetical protein VG228_01225, partial [Solirubrobacteraceae bacterium]|nr:hypothetical protein [Solirubrobacteraceae bacterium]